MRKTSSKVCKTLGQEIARRKKITHNKLGKTLKKASVDIVGSLEEARIYHDCNNPKMAEIHLRRAHKSLKDAWETYQFHA